jgi:hypothetical protein
MTKVTKIEQVTESRLCWPDSKPRAAHRVASPFKNRETGRETQQIEWEMHRWRVRQYIVSRNDQRIFAGDPGAAVWWNDRRGELRVLACDKYSKLADNLHAVYLTLDAMRALERWGAYTAEQAAEGARPALPPPASSGPPTPPWWEVLQVDRDWPIEAIEQLARVRAAKHHPDTGGSTEAFQTFNTALEEARREKA